MSSTDQAGPQTPEQRLPPSPCVGVCTLRGDYCYGCGRSGDEIAAWGNLSPGEQSAVWAELPGRLAQFGFRTFRLAASAAIVGDFIGRTFRETTGRWRVVATNVEGQFAVSETNRPDIDETRKTVTATSDQGERITLVKHERVRIFGFAGQAANPRMDTVALVLPKGLAQREPRASIIDAGQSTALSPAPSLGDSYTTIALSGSVASMVSQEAPGWFQLLRWFNGSQPDQSTSTLELANALSAIRTSAPVIAREIREGPANAPPDMKISRAFVTGAVFQADDPDWLAGALAP